MSAGRNRVQIALAQQHVVNALQFDGTAVLRLKEHGVAHFDTSHVGADGDHLRPTQSATYLGGCGDDDAAAGATFTVLTSFADEDAIVQEFDGNRSIRPRSGIWSRASAAVGSGQRRRRLRTLIVR